MPDPLRQAKRSKRSPARPVSCHASPVPTLMVHKRLQSQSPVAMNPAHQSHEQAHLNFHLILPSPSNSAATTNLPPPTNQLAVVVTSLNLTLLETRWFKNPINLEKPSTPIPEPTISPVSSETASHQVQCTRNPKPSHLVFKRRSPAPSNECLDERKCTKSTHRFCYPKRISPPFISFVPICKRGQRLATLFGPQNLGRLAGIE